MLELAESTPVTVNLSVPAVVTEERFALAFNRAIRRLQDVPREESTRQVLAMLDASPSRHASLSGSPLNPESAPSSCRG